MADNFTEIFEQIPDATLVADPEGRVFLANRAALVLTGYGVSELVGRNLEGILSAHASGLPADDIKGMVIQHRIVRMKDGTIVPVNVTLAVIPWESRTAIMATLRDATELARNPETKEYYETIFNAVDVEVATYSVHGTYEFVNHQAVRDEKLRQWIIGKNDIAYCEMKLLPPQIAHHRMEMLKMAAAEKRPVEFEEEISAHGWPRHFYRRIVPVLGPGNEVDRLVSIGMDVTKRKVAEDGMIFMALHDSLTGLPNRRHLMDQLKRILDVSEGPPASGAIVFIDLDGFKLVNDAFGHETGDQLLVEVGGRLGMAVRDEDLLARHGGDEFVLLLPGVSDQAEAELHVRDIHRALSESFQVNGRVFYVSASTGVTIFPEHSSDPETLLKYADMAMYHAKRRGRNQFQFYTYELQSKAVRRLEVEQALRSELEKGGGMRAFFQPIIDLHHGGTYGMEALVRWAAIPPDEFIPIAEDTGLVSFITDFMLKESCRENRNWQEIQSGVRVSVNVSSLEFNASLAARITKALGEASMDPPLLVVELTETALLQGGDATREALEALQLCGVAVAVDDFGAGYSSLRYLAEFPIDTIKIDRYFIQNIDTSRRQKEICRAIVALAHSLGIRVVAEGVEREGEFDVVRDLGFDAVQGYYLFKPMSGVDAIRHLERTRRP